MSIFRDPAFRTFWVGQSVSTLGSQVTVLALPLTGLTALGASPAQMGMLMAAQFAPALVVSLFAGVIVDRRRRRPLLIAADVGRAVVLAGITAGAVLGVLRIEHLSLAALLTGSLSVLSDVARSSYLPSLVGRERLVEAGGALATSQTVVGVAGPGLGGALVQLLSGPVAILADAASFLISAVCLGLIRRAEPAPLVTQRRNLTMEIAEGFRAVVGHPVLRAIAGSTGLVNLFAGWVTAIEIVFFTAELRLTPAGLGSILAAVGLAAPLGAALAPWAGRRFGVGPAAIAALGAWCAAHVPVATAAGSPAVVAATLAAALVAMRVVMPVFTVNQSALRQAVTPDHLFGRVSATNRLLSHGLVPMGALLGGFVAEAVGLRASMGIAVAGQFLAVLWLSLSPVRTARRGGVD